jgi:hypothetical protein
VKARIEVEPIRSQSQPSGEKFARVRSEIRRIKSIAIEPTPEHGLDARSPPAGWHRTWGSRTACAVFVEPPVEATGKPPTSVFPVGRHGDAHRTALFDQVRDDDDD